MASKDWKFTLEDGEHNVHLEHTWFSGKRKILLDGKPIVQESKFFDFGNEYPFRIGGHQGLVTIRTNGLSFAYDVAIDGKSITTGKPVARVNAIPGWAWSFIVVCVLIPIVSLGGVVPMLIGFMGAYGCAQVSRDGSKDHNTRLLTCAGITVLCWIIYVAFIYIVVGMTNR